MKRASTPARLPVTLVAGMPVYQIEDTLPGIVETVTDGYCIYRLGGSLTVSPWRHLAVGNVTPDKQGLPADVTNRDRINAQAAVLMELLALQPLGFTEIQQQAHDELVAMLTRDPASNA